MQGCSMDLGYYIKDVIQKHITTKIDLQIITSSIIKELIENKPTSKLPFSITSSNVTIKKLLNIFPINEKFLITYNAKLQLYILERINHLIPKTNQLLISQEITNPNLLTDIKYSPLCKLDVILILS